MRRRTQALLDELHLPLDPKRLVAGLGVAQQQMVEIAKALSLDAKLLIMDEPTSALTDTEINQLFTLIRRLKERGVSVVFISHHLDEVFEICDRGTVLRDGEYIDTVDLAQVTEEDIIRLMVGRNLDQQYPEAAADRGEEALRVEGLNQEGVLHDISFTAYTGEILGIAGLVGAGRTELMRAIFGADPIDFRARLHLRQRDRGQIAAGGDPGRGRSAAGGSQTARAWCFMLSVLHNMSMASLDRLTSNLLLRKGDERKQANGFVDKLRIITPSINQQVQYLSGGNQQKVVLAKWLASQSKILIFDEPTRGIDVGAKVEVYNLMNNLVENGVAVVMVSSEMPELLGMSDRILVMHEGRIAAELSRQEATQEKVLAAAMGADGDD